MSQADFSRNLWLEVINTTSGEIPAGTIITLPKGGDIEIADQTVVSQSNRILAILQETVRSNRRVMAIVFGIIESNSFNFDLTKSIYLSISGTITQVAPTTGVLRVLGNPVTTKEFYFYPSPAIVLA